MVGAGMSAFGIRADVTNRELFAEAFLDMKKSVDKGFDPKDIEALYDMFVSLYSSKLKRPIIGTSAEAMRRLLSYEWPGNVRELANVVERAVTLCEHDTIVPEDLILGQPHQQNDPLEVAAVQRRSLADVERTYVRRMVEVAGGNKTLAARILGIDRRTLYRRLDETMAAKSDRTDRIVSARHKSP